MTTDPTETISYCTVCEEGNHCLITDFKDDKKCIECNHSKDFHIVTE